MLYFCQMSKTLTIRLPRDLAAWLEETTARNGVPRGRVIREALERVRAGEAGRPFLRLAGTIHGPRDLSGRRGFSRP